ncbi:hypothetical protein [Bifidobacterium sp. ESL0732]|uniref:hypothetical protein n=1 Tax=Bifidobacterium sp. ESL0732 TaxID=2983222 RepID=UPI0023F65776|nr:hypothetical protein [Bifidobacterium sp. ESL0732]WEV64142.1 hypothetical protein OZX70_00655 [Bifidobacterium sp. ESL0732]
MELKISDWQGRWENFELWLDSDDPVLTQAWQEVESAIANGTIPARFAKAFGPDPRAFWKPLNATAMNGNASKLGNWEIRPSTDGTNSIEITWFAADGQNLGSARYAPDHTVAKGLEGKPNLLLRAVEPTIVNPASETGSAQANTDWPFRWLMMMEPMPERTERENGGLIAHTHFQFGPEVATIVDVDDKLTNPRWYATMCDEPRNNAERIRTIRSLHGLEWK